MLTRIGCFTLVGLLCIGNVAFAQFESAATDHHQVLKRDVGEWNAAMTVWMPGQDEPIKAEGVEKNTMLGDLWLLSEFKGEFFGAEFVGSGQFGYDPNKEKFVGTWIDNMTPSMSYMEGSWDYESQTMTYMTKGTNPETGGEMIGKNVTVYDGEDAHTMTMYTKDESGEFVKSMEIVYTRRD